ncbi:GNAT family N-acetyltransferase [Vibrio sp.]|nr:GNAT family N-acetyltransferase [Vibrio sp.]
MPELQIAILEPIKVPLVSRLYKQYYPSGKAKKDELIITGELDKQLVAVVRFRRIADYRLLTGMLVVPTHQGQGLGHQLMQHCQSHILENKDFCFAYTHLEGFYSQHGFVKLDAEQLPAELKTLFIRYTDSGKKLTAMQFIDGE